MVKFGIIGLGFMGYTHFTASRWLRGGKVTPIATRDMAVYDAAAGLTPAAGGGR